MFVSLSILQFVRVFNVNPKKYRELIQKTLLLVIISSCETPNSVPSLLIFEDFLLKIELKLRVGLKENIVVESIFLLFFASTHLKIMGI